MQAYAKTVYLAPTHTKLLPCISCDQLLYTHNDINDDAIKHKINTHHINTSLHCTAPDASTGTSNRNLQSYPKYRLLIQLTSVLNNTKCTKKYKINAQSIIKLQVKSIIYQNDHQLGPIGKQAYDSGIISNNMI